MAEARRSKRLHQEIFDAEKEWFRATVQEGLEKAQRTLRELYIEPAIQCRWMPC